LTMLYALLWMTILNDDVRPLVPVLPISIVCHQEHERPTSTEAKETFQSSDHLIISSILKHIPSPTTAYIVTYPIYNTRMRSQILEKLSMTGLSVWSALGLLWLSWVIYRFVKAYQRAVVSQSS
jgi:hypothetical protein